MDWQRNWNLIVSGGGSGGHLFPALAVVDELRQGDSPPQRVLFLTARRPIDDQILSRYQVEQLSLGTIGSSELRSRPLRSTYALSRTIATAVRTLRQLSPCVVLGTGGYGSLPGVVAARWTGQPVVLLEQNVIPGRATSVLSRLADVVCTSFEETAKTLPRRTRSIVTGNPVRREIAALAAISPANERESPPTLFLAGGSQGAFALNSAMELCVRHTDLALLRRWRFIHQSGRQERDRVAQTYQSVSAAARIAPFFSDVPAIYRSASLAVSRAGATSLAELACAGLPALLVPYPNSIRDHQLVNARWYADRGAARIVEQGTSVEAFQQQFMSVLQQLMTDDDQRSTMSTAMRALARPDAAQQVAEVIRSLIAEK
ncbi:undecaprenyldiphospho-muramoylpentapeptide beta-N-acetylglucosaminyltransferase [Planctomicrobium sp. SH664]|uniref:undecaprenyldiphospho-muramoylpentapeptide beta-N-acetylglucosaminyltransferase n=1 Tax=Planctomicrobium sp. SH664 TaxID=3448125 RepID=UPI003F5B09F4